MCRARLNISREEFRADYQRVEPRLRAHQTDTVAVYCSGADCHDADLVANALATLGYGKNVYLPRGLGRMVPIRVAAREMRRQYVIAALRMLLGAVFVYAGMVKIQATADFADSIAGFRLLPPGLSNLLALGLPPFEILLGLWLLVGWQHRTAAFCALILCGVFLLALVSALARGIAVDCGCFGATQNSLLSGQRTWISIGRDLALMAMAAVVYAEAWRHSRL